MSWHKKSKTNLTKLRLLRIVVQFVMFILMNLMVFSIGATWLVLPVELSQTYFSTSEGAFFLMQRMLAKGIIPLIPLASILIIGSIFGRLFCSWGCPFGLVQDIVGLLFSPFQKYEPTKETNDKLRVIGESIATLTLGISLIIGVNVGMGNSTEMVELFGLFFDSSWAVFSPASFLFTGVPLLFYWEGLSSVFESQVDIGFYVRLAILLFSIILVVYIPRGWCRWFCPLGIIMGILGKHSFLGISRNISQCNQCGKCEDVCPMGVRILDHQPSKIRSVHCTLCLDCVSECPHNALEIKFN